jgi:uncharacterized protein YjiS (DUF1127 family)
MFHHSHDPKEIVFFPYVYPYVGLVPSMRNLNHGLPRQEIQYLNWGLTTGRLFKRLGNVLRGWNNRRIARLTLYRMDERMLNDIGLSRGDIETAICNRSLTLPVGLEKSVRAWIQSVRAWIQSDRARRALYAMDKRTLSDIGISRGDIERVATNRYDGPNAVKITIHESPVAKIEPLAEVKPTAFLVNTEHKHAA